MPNKRAGHRMALSFFCLILTVIIAACSSNQPPQKPQIIGRGWAFVQDTVVIKIYSLDPEDNVITYYIDWGDTTKPQWSPFFQSGETIPRSHIYTVTGIYFIRVKARDIDRAESEWSDSFKMDIQPDTARPARTENN
jgi:hypothetical protein